MSDVIDRLRSALADNYAIDREIGAGGMATVYLAQDLKHHRKVAVKVLRPELAATLGPERFLREIEVAAQLTHPHILPLHDSGEAGGFLYYVMPFIEGESLRERLAREGSLPIGDTVKIIREIVDALASAHRNGVVHRDIKPDNVMLSQNHALVTDFGVAKAVSEATGREQLTTAGVALGTPSYMAPEQATADPNIDQRVDIYAIGAVAYELLAGRPPFSGNTSQAVLAAHVTQTPDPVTKHRTAVPPALANIVMRCLEKNRADRWQTADELLPQLEALSTPSGGVTPTTAVPVATATVPTSRNVNWVLATVVGLTALVAVPAWMITRGGDAEPHEERILVAVFDNETGDPSLDHVGKIFADWLARGIMETELVDVVDPRAMIAATGEGPPKRPRDIAKQTGAGTVVSGAYYKQGDSLQIQANLVDARSGEVLHALEPVTAPAAQPLEAAQLLAQRVMGGVAAEFPDVVMGTEMRVERAPRNYDAYREYVAGVEIFARGRQAESLPYFERAIALDSTMVAAAIQQAVVHSNAGRWGVTDSIVTWMSRFRRQLTEVERHQLDWLDGTVSGNLAKGFRAYDAIFQQLPSDATNRFLVGYYAYRTNRLEYAVDILNAEPRLDFWGTYWGDLTGALHMLGNYEQELEAARMGREALPDSPTRLRQWVRALIGLGRIDQVRSSIDEVLTFPAGNPATHLGTIADYLAVHGHPEDAAEFRKLAVQHHRDRVESNPDNPDLRYRLAMQLYASGAIDEARRGLEGLVQTAPDTTRFLGAFGAVSAAAGDSIMALQMDQRLATLELPYLRGGNTHWRARIAAVRGHRERAVALLRQAHGEGVGLTLSVTHYDLMLDSLRGYGQFEEFIRPRN